MIFKNITVHHELQYNSKLFADNILVCDLRTVRSN